MANQVSDRRINREAEPERPGFANENDPMLRFTGERAGLLYVALMTKRRELVSIWRAKVAEGAPLSETETTQLCDLVEALIDEQVRMRLAMNESAKLGMQIEQAVLGLRRQLLLFGEIEISVDTGRFPATADDVAEEMKRLRARVRDDDEEGDQA